MEADVITEVTENVNHLPTDVMSKQPTINIGVVGQSGHGKSTLVKALSGVQTAKHQSERERGLTIKLGYANAKIYKCDNPEMPRPQCYTSRGSSHPDEFPCDVAGCKGKFKFVRYVSFLDCPGIDILLATMLRAAPVMDAALLVVGVNVPGLQPQALEHLAALEIFKQKHILIVQNKTDLVEESHVQIHRDEILAQGYGTIAECAPICEISAHFQHNISTICQYIVESIPVPLRNLDAKPILRVIRSFDIKKPGCTKNNMKGGVLGGSLHMGELKVGDAIEVCPGIVTKDKDGSVTCAPLLTRIMSLQTENIDLQHAHPGGLIGVGTKIDPTLCRADRMVGQVLGAVKALPNIYIELEISYFLLRRLLGIKTKDNEKGERVKRLMKREVLMLTIGTLCCGSQVSAVRADMARLVLTTAVCAEIGDKVILCRKVNWHWRLIGWGEIRSGVDAKVSRPD